MDPPLWMERMTWVPVDVHVRRQHHRGVSPRGERLGFVSVLGEAWKDEESWTTEGSWW